MTNYIPEENAKVIRKLLTECKKENPELFFHIWDTESKIVKTKDIDKAIEAIDGGDEEIGINCYGADKNCLGWFGILPYEDDAECVIYDHSDNYFCNSISGRI